MASIPLPERIDKIAAVPPDPPTAAGVLERLKEIQRIFPARPLMNVAEPTGLSADLHTALSDLKKIPDGVACFNHLYKVITAEIKNKIKEGEAKNKIGEEGFFHNNEFMNGFDVLFANRYFGAIQKYVDSPKDAPKCWRILFENRKDHDVSPMEFAIYGVACHVLLDLPIATVEVCKAMGMSLDDQTHYDFQKINEIFYKKIPKLRWHFESLSERRFDQSIVRNVVNHVCDFIVVQARDIAWIHAKELWEVWDSPDKRKKKIDSLDNLASNFWPGNCRASLTALEPKFIRAAIANIHRTIHLQGSVCIDNSHFRRSASLPSNATSRY